MERRSQRKDEGVENAIRYTGQRYEEELEGYCLGVREYREEYGKFLTEDAYEGDGTNLYAYCRNNPIKYYDPSGYSGEANEKGHTTPEGEEGKTPSAGTKGESETRNSLWKPAKSKNNLWNKGKLKTHYDKHGGDFGAKSASEYSAMAVEFGIRNSDDIIQTIHEGYVYRYEPSTNTVFVGTEKGGRVKSFYVWDGRENDFVINTLKDLDLIP